MGDAAAPAPDHSGALVAALDLRHHRAVTEHSDGRAHAVALEPGPARRRGDTRAAESSGRSGRSGADRPRRRRRHRGARRSTKTSNTPPTVRLTSSATSPQPLRPPWSSPRFVRRTGAARRRSTPGGAPSISRSASSRVGRSTRRRTTSSCATPRTPSRSRSAGGQATPATPVPRSSHSRTHPKQASRARPCRRRPRTGTPSWASTSSTGMTPAAHPTPMRSPWSSGARLSAMPRGVQLGLDSGGERRRRPSADHGVAPSPAPSGVEAFFEPNRDAVTFLLLEDSP